MPTVGWVWDSDVPPDFIQRGLEPGRGFEGQGHESSPSGSLPPLVPCREPAMGPMQGPKASSAEYRMSVS